MVFYHLKFHIPNHNASITHCHDSEKEIYFPYLTRTLKALMKFIPVLLQLCVSNKASTTFYDWLGYRPPLGTADSNLRQNLLFLGTVDIITV
jgi:hypothetical protein